ncbi:hypothetical protein [Skermania piniformis]|uniref:Uncharacterized protein n=1 Tax=Skermania pinensis TaxID=39122 RepID=A0ABX8S8G7_9ACTN|nr:hypothetical protein [Skermania piniformis]QXQ14114.1 hypothetical protein KV203_01255 [Skermania piniformis]
MADITGTKPTESTFDPRRPIYATVGAGYAAFDAVSELVSKTRARVSETRGDFGDQVSALRERLGDLPVDVPDDLAGLRDKLSYDELRRTAEDRYSDFVERGANELSDRPNVEQQLDRVDSLYHDAIAALDKVGDQVAKLTGRIGD